MPNEERLINHLVRQQADYRLISHPVCRTSAESADARAAGGATDAIGAKALVVSTRDGFAMLVLPGMMRLDSKAARGLIGKFRFAKPQEVNDATGGLEIGTIPPFTNPVCPGIARLIVDERIINSNTIGFNAACLTRSVIMRAEEYARVAVYECVANISEDATN